MGCLRHRGRVLHSNYIYLRAITVGGKRFFAKKIGLESSIVSFYGYAACFYIFRCTLAWCAVTIYQNHNIRPHLPSNKTRITKVKEGDKAGYSRMLFMKMQTA